MEGVDADVATLMRTWVLSFLLVAVFATMVLYERPTLREWVGILFVAAGVLILGFTQ